VGFRAGGVRVSFKKMDQRSRIPVETPGIPALTAPDDRFVSAVIRLIGR
jgi:hypothetical protein